jgi:hypothetical protein
VEDLLTMMIGLAVCIAFATVAFWSTRLECMSCRECGAGLPVVRLSNHTEDPVLGDWTCPKCGTRFDRQARARNQLPS